MPNPTENSIAELRERIATLKDRCAALSREQERTAADLLEAKAQLNQVRTQCAGRAAAYA